MNLVKYFEVLCLILNLIWLTCFWIYTTNDVLYPKFIQSSINPLVSRYKYKSYILNKIQAKMNFTSKQSNEINTLIKANYNITKNIYLYDENFYIIINKQYIFILRVSKRKKRFNKHSGSNN